MTTASINNSSITSTGSRIRPGKKVTIVTMGNPHGIRGTVSRRAEYRGKKLKTWLVDVGDGCVVVGGSQMI